MKKLPALFPVLALTTLINPAALGQDIVVRDGEISISKEELAYSVANWTQQMRQVAIEDQGDRLELLNMTLVNKKLAAEAERVASENQELYLEYQSRMRSHQRNFLLGHIRDSLEYPDFGPLAREQYTVKKEKYALIPETRMSSHILFAAPAGQPREEVLARAQGVLDELKAGGDFVAAVKQHSEEPGAAAREGKFNRWVRFGEPGVSPPYTEALFSIENQGQYSDLVQTQFGVHIIRLDGVKAQAYKPYEEVEGAIINDLKTEYTKLAMKDYLSRFNMSDEVYIDAEAVEAILAPYTKSE